MAQANPVSTGFEIPQHEANKVLKALLRAIADGSIPNIPWSFDILLLGQTTLEEDVVALSLAEETVLQHVIKSDRTRERYTREAKSMMSHIPLSFLFYEG